MGTSDGISTEDWDRVTELAFEVWKHLGDAEKDRRYQDLFDFLDSLEARYGSVPSILATRADFTSPHEVRNKEELLVRAYALAIERADGLNALQIAHSLADLYLGMLQEPLEGRRWLACFGTQLYSDPQDPWWSEEYERLKELAETFDPSA